MGKVEVLYIVGVKVDKISLVGLRILYILIIYVFGNEVLIKLNIFI